MRLKLVLALLALGMIPVTFTSCGDDTPDKGFELISNMVLKNFFEGYASLEIEEFTLIQETEGESVRFTFTGTQRVDETLQFSYSGYVVYGKLYIEFNIQ